MVLTSTNDIKTQTYDPTKKCIDILSFYTSFFCITSQENMFRAVSSEIQSTTNIIAQQKVFFKTVKDSISRQKIKFI